MARKVHSFDPQEAHRKILTQARTNQTEALAILKEVFGTSIIGSDARPVKSLERIATLAKKLERNVQDLERVTLIPKPKQSQPQFKPRRKGKRQASR